jgi:hypothetical protein
MALRLSEVKRSACAPTRLRTMRLHRRATRRLCFWLSLLLLCAQLATAAYACPALADVAAARMAAMPGCDGKMSAAMDPEQPLLCQAHCQQGSQTLNAVPLLDAPVSPLLLAVLDWRPTQPARDSAVARRPERAAGAAPPGSPPLYLRLLVLRY